ncbi:NAD(P)/FAD-dependent oxidoreductase [Clostridium sp.]|uniref:NAD(P)/FAD-dependent oxidoreductase n=1 Tax=Clostridium sp. TaxID=1506 RepID=UPI002FC622E7
MIYHDLIIVGGGASGLMSAILAKDLGLDVAILEGTDRVGRKILTTGNGRCNISNASVKYPFVNYHSSNKDFFINALNSFSIEDTRNFFLSIGLPIVELENSKLYPQSLQASSVVDILRLAIEDKNIPLYTNCKVKTIHKKNKFILSTGNEEFSEFSSKKLLLCCGGKSAVKTGSDGSGYRLAEDLGHTITSTMPGIVQLKLDYPRLKGLSGIKFDGKVSLISNNFVVREESGEILFTDYGISGPPILQISSTASRHLKNHDNVWIKLDMMENKSLDDVSNFFYGHLAMFSHRSISNALIGVLNKKLVPILLKDIGIHDIHTPCYDVEWQYQNALINRMKDWQFKCTGTKEFANAQVTVGGVNTSEVNSETLESKKVKDLYFAGELLDVDGDCGGFNLQWAWSSAFLAVNSLSKS